MWLPKEQCAESKKGHLRCYCSPVWVTNGGRIPWIAVPICESGSTGCTYCKGQAVIADEIWWADSMECCCCYLRNVQDLLADGSPCKNKTSQETQRSLQKFLEPDRKPKVIYTDNSLEFGKACEDLSWDIVRRHHTDQKQMGLQKEQCVEWKKAHLRYYCNQVWMKTGGRIPWNAVAIWETFKISCLMGRHIWKAPFNGPVIPFGATVEYHLFCAKDQSGLHHFGAKVLPGIFLGYALYAGGIWKETLWSQALKDWMRWTHQNSTPEGSMQRKC